MGGRRRDGFQEQGNRHDRDFFSGWIPPDPEKEGQFFFPTEHPSNPGEADIHVRHGPSRAGRRESPMGRGSAAEDRRDDEELRVRMGGEQGRVEIAGQGRLEVEKGQ